MEQNTPQQITLAKAKDLVAKKHHWEKWSDMLDTGMDEGILQIYSDEAAELYASQRVKELEGENEILKHWKKVMMDLTRPIFEWGQSKESGLEPGASIFDEVIRRVRAYKSLKLEVERLRDVFGLSESWPLHHVINSLIEAARILLHEKNYDRLGWEEYEHTMQRAKQYVEKIEKALTSENQK